MTSWLVYGKLPSTEFWIEDTHDDSNLWEQYKLSEAYLDVSIIPTQVAQDILFAGQVSAILTKAKKRQENQEQWLQEQVNLLFARASDGAMEFKGTINALDMTIKSTVLSQWATKSLYE